MIDEDPSQKDIDRFSDDTARCMYCGAEVYDDCLECPACKTAFTTPSPSSPHKVPIKIDLANKVGVFLVILLLLAFFWGPITSFLGL